MKIRNTFILFASTFLVSAFLGYKLSEQPVEAAIAAGYTYGDAATYYSGISNNLTGSSLLEALNSLNSKKRQSTVGYSNMPANYKYTDYDPAYSSLDENGVRYGEKLLSFYSGTSATYSGGGMNREHVWPNSRGGNKVEKDIHMPRPTVASENGSRGNSFYVEGKKSSTSGWDPAMESFGDETYRGDSARIIFYSAIADTALTLIDAENDNANNNTMGKLSDMIKWHLTYPVQEREMNRNEGAEYLQGNRNPFIDHPEYVCRIWGNTNDVTKSLCAKDPYAAKAPTSISLNKTSTTIKLEQTEQLIVSSVNPSDASKNVSWSSSNSNIVSVSNEGLITGVALGTATITATSTYASSVKATCTVTVEEPSPIALQDITVSPAKIETFVGKSAQIATILSPNYVYPKANISYSSSNSGVASVTQEGLVKGVAIGETSITVTATQGNNVITKSIPVTVDASAEPTYDLITSNSQLATGDTVVISTALGEHCNGVTGLNGTKDAAISENREEWLPYEVTSVSSGFKLYDPNAKQYIASPSSSSNEFKYGDEAGVCSVDSEGHLMCNGKYLCKNNSYVRFYGSISSSYTPLFVYSYSYGGGSVIPPTQVELSSIRLSGQTTETTIGKQYTFDGKVYAVYSDGTSKEVSGYTVSAVDTSNLGDVIVTVTYTENGVTKTATFTLKVKSAQPVTTGYELITSVDALAEGDKVVLATSLESTGEGVSGANSNNKDASASTDRSEWLPYKIEKDTSGFKLYDESAKQYIASPTGKEFKYSSTAGVFQVDSEGCLLGNEKFLCHNPDGYYRFYGSTTSGLDKYSKFHVYKLTESVEPGEVTLESIALSGQTTSFEVDDTFSFDGVVTATYSDGTTKEVTPTSVSTVDMSTAGTKNVTVSYTEDNITRIAIYSITVTAKAVVPVKIELSNYSTEIYVGDRFFFDGDVIVYFSDGSTKDNVQLTITDPFTNKPGQVTITVTYEEGDIEVSASYILTIKERPVVLESIAISNQTTEINVGDRYVFDGKVVATYSDGTSKEVTDYTVGDVDTSIAGKAIVTISYTDGDVTETASFELTIKGQEVAPTATLVSISISDYSETVDAGEDYRFDGKVVATYSDGSTKQVTNYTVSYVDTSEVGKITVTITYSEENATETASFELHVFGLVSITASEFVSRVEVGELYEFTGKVTATYSDGTTKEVSNYSISGIDTSKVGVVVITISYTENDITKIYQFELNVVEKQIVPQPVELTSISVSGYTSEIDFGEAYVFDGVVTANYSDGTSKEVTNYSVSNVDTSEAGKVSVTISYTEGEITKTATFEITVNEEVLPELPTLVSITASDYNNVIVVGDTYVFNGKVVATYSDGSSKEINGFTVSTGDLSKAGTVTVTITYVENDVTRTFSFEITIKDKETNNTPISSFGCGGSVTATSIILSTISLAGAGLLLLKKKRKY